MKIMLKLLILSSDTLSKKTLSAIHVLKKLYELELIGVCYLQEKIKKNTIKVENEEITIIKKDDLSSIEFDILLVSSEVFSYKIVDDLQIPSNKVLIDRVVCIPGFTIKKYEQLKMSHLTIFSRNCAGGLLYHYMGLQFMSPTINMFFRNIDEYLEFLRSPIEYLNEDLIFHEMMYEPNLRENYPVFMLGDIHLHMNHYGKMEIDEVKKIWKKRCSRINWFNVLVLISTTSLDVACKFNALPYAKKVCITSFKSNLSSAYYIDKWDKSNKDCSQFDIELYANRFASGHEYFGYNMWEMLLYGKMVNV